MNGYTCQRCGNCTTPSHMDSDGYEVRYCGECGEYWIIDGGDDYDDEDYGVACPSCGYEFRDGDTIINDLCQSCADERYGDPL